MLHVNATCGRLPLPASLSVRVRPPIRPIAVGRSLGNIVKCAGHESAIISDLFFANSLCTAPAFTTAIGLGTPPCSPLWNPNSLPSERDCRSVNGFIVVAKILKEDIDEPEEHSVALAFLHAFPAKQIYLVSSARSMCPLGRPVPARTAAAAGEIKAGEVKLFNFHFRNRLPRRPLSEPRICTRWTERTSGRRDGRTDGRNDGCPAAHLTPS